MSMSLRTSITLWNNITIFQNHVLKEDVTVGALIIDRYWFDLLAFLGCIAGVGQGAGLVVDTHFMAAGIDDDAPFTASWDQLIKLIIDLVGNLSEELWHFSIKHAEVERGIKQQP